MMRYAAMAGMALGCHVHHRSRFDRKNYFYPDLPKAYQISQFYRPLCEGGALTIQTSQGEKRVGITRIHIEEDAGKLLHDEANGTALDMNRCGVPLIEIVSEPDIRSAEEAVAYLRKLRAILTYTGVSDCRMNEGSMRCDVNLSVRRPGEPFGVRTEMKNLNSFQSVERAIEAEYRRQVEALETGEGVVQETRRYDQKTGKTTSMRRKENSADYRYFPDPDLPEIYLSDAEMAEIRRSTTSVSRPALAAYSALPHKAQAVGRFKIMACVLLSVSTGTENARPHMRYAGAGDDFSLAVPPCLNAPKGLHSLSGAVSRASRPVGGWCPSVRGIRRLQPGRRSLKCPITMARPASSEARSL